MKNIKLAFFLAWKSLSRGNKSSLALVIIIMMIVFLNLLFTDSIFAGITHGITYRKIDYQYGELMIEPKTGDSFIIETNSIIDFLRDNQYVRKIAPITEVSVAFINEKSGDGRDFEKMGGTIIGIDVTDVNQEVFDIRSKMLDGRFLEDDDYGKILLGSGLAGGYKGSMFSDDLGNVRDGDKIIVEIGNVRKEYEIVGIFRTKNSNLDRKGIILDKEMRSILGINDETSKIIVRLSDNTKSAAIVEELRNSRFRDYEIADWKEKTAAGAGIEKSFEMIGSLLRIIGSLVAGLVIFIIVFVDIVNKRRQIGILKAIGIKEEIIINSYIIRGVFYTIIGSILGYLLMEFVIIAAFMKYPLDLPMGDIVPLLKKSALVASVVFFLIAGLVGSTIPAVKEIKKKILDLLYH